jgi:hypothetical protein
MLAVMREDWKYCLPGVHCSSICQQALLILAAVVAQFTHCVPTRALVAYCVSMLLHAVHAVVLLDTSLLQ